LWGGGGGMGHVSHTVQLQKSGVSQKQ